MLWRRPSLCALLAIAIWAPPARGGAPDLTFGVNGVASLPTGGVSGIALDASERILTAAGSTSSVLGGFVLARMLPDGTPDPGFGSGGVVTTDFGPGDETAVAVAVQADGKVVGAGAASGATSLALARYDASGGLDPTFGTGGLVVTTAGRPAVAVLVEPGGNLVAAGCCLPTSTLVRYLSDGTLDASFGVGGIVSGPGAARFAALTRQPDGRLLVAGDSGGDVWLGRYDAMGAPDMSFGVSGAVTTSLSSASDHATTVVLQPDGSIVVAGSALEHSQLALVRYLADGSLDPSFGTGGVTLGAVPSPFPGMGIWNSLVLQPDGKLVAGGLVVSLVQTPGGLVPTLSMLLGRYLGDGTLDPTFTFRAEGLTAGITSLVLQGDGRIVTGGAALLPGPSFGGQLRRYFGEGVCGDGILDPGEQCEAGDVCCVPFGDCRFASSGTSCPCDGDTCTRDQCNGAGTCVHPPAPDGLGCDDGNQCTTGDQCQAGVCVGQPSVSPLFCTVCDPALGPVQRPRTGCKHTTLPGKAGLAFKRRESDEHDAVTWKWSKGEATTLAELGDPIGMMDALVVHDLCVWDESGPEPLLAFATGAEPNNVPFCARPPCWKAKGATGLRYRSSPPNPFGVKTLTLTAGPAGKAKNSLAGKGPGLLMPSLPLPASLRVQLGARDGACWEASFSATGSRKNTANDFKAKSD